MSVVAKLKYLRIAPRKVRLVADLIRRKKAGEAQTILNFTTKKASQSLLKLLNQAVSNAKNNFQLDPDNLYISKITVDEGPKYKRWRARARGQAYEIQKKTSHLTITLDEIEKKPKKVKAPVQPVPAKKEAPKKPKVVEKAKKKEEGEEIVKWEKPKPKPETEIRKPKVEKGIKRVFKRKAF